MSHQPDLFYGDKTPPKHYAERHFRPEPKACAKPYAWVGMASWVRHVGHLLAIETASGDHYHRVRETARELTADRIRECRHDDDLERAEAMLAEARRGFSGALYGLERALPKGELGTLLMEVRNRRRLLALGRDHARERGPRLDPAHLPMKAIERLIQHHRDMTLVEQLRAERARRLDASRAIGDTGPD